MGSEEVDAEPGYVIRAPAGVTHQWRNKPERLMLLSVQIHPSSYELAEEAVKMNFL